MKKPYILFKIKCLLSWSMFLQRENLLVLFLKSAKLQPDKAVVQVDFAENYTWQHQDEIQATHRNQQQVTLVTVVIWTKDSASNTTCNSHVTGSHGLSNDNLESVAIFMVTVVNNFVRKSYPQVRVVSIFSNGPSSQFKLKYMTGFYHTLQSKGLEIMWHFCHFAWQRGGRWPGSNCEKEGAECSVHHESAKCVGVLY